MQASDVFLNRAHECELMAKFTRDAGSKATWTRMAERWHRCAELEISASLAASAHHEATRYRKRIPGWALHH